MAGIILHQFGRLPKLGETVFAEGCRFEVIDLDGLRVDKVLVTVTA